MKDSNAQKRVRILGAGLAGSEAALQLSARGFQVHLVEMRPKAKTAVHQSDYCAELVCSNSLKSMNPHSAAGMLKFELEVLQSYVYQSAVRNSVPAGGALAVDRNAFARLITEMIEADPRIVFERRCAFDIEDEAQDVDAIIIATGPLTHDDLACSLAKLTGSDHLAFYDAAAPIVLAESLDQSKLFRQSRYENTTGDYLNAPFDKETYEAFVDALLEADLVILRDFEIKELFQACQPVEQIARTGREALRFGALKPVGLTDPATGKRPWAVVQLRAENAALTSYNLVGFQTNLTFPEQERVFRMIPGLEHAEFARHGVMHRNTFIDAPHLLDSSLRLQSQAAQSLYVPIYVAGQVSGTEGYLEAVRSGLHAALSVSAVLTGTFLPELPKETAFGALLSYATSEETLDYQPSHVNFGMLPPLEKHIKNKKERYRLYASRGAKKIVSYAHELIDRDLLLERVDSVDRIYDNLMHDAFGSAANQRKGVSSD